MMWGLVAYRRDRMILVEALSQVWCSIQFISGSIPSFIRLGWCHPRQRDEIPASSYTSLLLCCGKLYHRPFQYNILRMLYLKFNSGSRVTQVFSASKDFLCAYGPSWKFPNMYNQYQSPKSKSRWFHIDGKGSWPARKFGVIKYNAAVIVSEYSGTYSTLQKNLSFWPSCRRGFTE